MKNKMYLLATLGLLPLLVLLSLGSASAQTDIAKAIQERLSAQIEKLRILALMKSTNTAVRSHRERGACSTACKPMRTR